MGKINKSWHAANVMPSNATPEQRIAWHLSHAEHCACRAIPGGVLELMRARGMTIPQSSQVRAPDRNK